MATAAVLHGEMSSVAHGNITTLLPFQEIIVVPFLFYRITEYLKLQGTHKDHQV